jgi:hypothetical protein
MSSSSRESVGYVASGGVQALSAEALADLMPAVLARGVPFRFEARGVSMWPFIRDADVVTVAQVVRRPRLGDVVAARAPGGRRIVVHRVVALGRDACLIRADNCEREDGDVPYPDVLGVVTRVDRGSQHIRFGLGPERMAITLLSRAAVLRPLLGAAWSLRGLVVRGGAP